MAGMVVILGAQKDDNYAHGHGYSSHHHPPRARAHRHSRQPPPPPSLSSSSYPPSEPPSLPRIWEPDPHTAKVDSRRSSNSNRGRTPETRSASSKGKFDAVEASYVQKAVDNWQLQRRSLGRSPAVYRSPRTTGYSVAVDQDYDHCI